MVRIITDDTQATATGSDVARLAKVTGVQVRHDGNQQAHMHHKFAVIDGAVLLNGSFNWTRAAVIANRENIVITRHAPSLLSQFGGQFEMMWTEFSRNTRVPAPHH